MALPLGNGVQWGVVETKIGPGKSIANYDIGAITVGAVGITLIILARLVRDAERDRAELDEIL